MQNIPQKISSNDESHKILIYLEYFLIGFYSLSAASGILNLAFNIEIPVLLWGLIWPFAIASLGLLFMYYFILILIPVAGIIFWKKTLKIHLLLILVILIHFLTFLFVISHGLNRIGV